GVGGGGAGFSPRALGGRGGGVCLGGGGWGGCFFYITLRVGWGGLVRAGAFLFAPPYLRRALNIDWWGLAFMVVGFGCLQLFLDRGERLDWVASSTIVALALIAVAAVAAFMIRELTAREPIPDLRVFTDPHLATRLTLTPIIV